MEKVTFLERFLGTGDLTSVLLFLAWAIVGVAFSLYVHSSNRKPDSYTSPRRFSWLYLLRDNWKRIIMSAVLILITIRFSKELLGFEMTDFKALMIGVCFDKLGELLQNKKILIGK